MSRILKGLLLTWLTVTLVMARSAICASLATPIWNRSWADHSKFAHPMGPNVADPLRPGESLNCLSCHNPHAREHKMILTNAPERDLCIGCHENLHEGG